MPCCPLWYSCASASDPRTGFTGTELRHRYIDIGFRGLAIYSVNQKLLVLMYVRLLKTYYGTILMRLECHLAEYAYVIYHSIICGAFFFSPKIGNKEIWSQNITSHFYTVWSIDKNDFSWSLIFGFVGLEILVPKKRLLPPWHTSVFP